MFKTELVGIMDELERKPDRDAGPQTDENSVAPKRPATGRRRLLTGGLSATGVVLTLSSRPVLGWQCKTPSAQGSMTHESHRPDVGGVSAPLTLAEWKGKVLSSWPDNSNKKFKRVFGGSNETRMFDVLQEGVGDDPFFVVAYLNVFQGDVSCLTMVDLVSMYQGRYVGPNGLHWMRNDVMTYLNASGIAAPI